jgi:hypothetical protein
MLWPYSNPALPSLATPSTAQPSLLHSTLAERIDVYSFDAVGMRLHRALRGPLKLASREGVKELLRNASGAAGGHKFSLHFLLTEWEQVVDAWQLHNWEAYRDVARLGRKTRLPEAQRAILWFVFERMRNEMKERGLMTHAGMFTALASTLTISNRRRSTLPWWMRHRTSACRNCASSQRWEEAGPMLSFLPATLASVFSSSPFRGIDIRGRARTLRVNYRTSHQIRQQADRLLGPEMTDVVRNTAATPFRTSTARRPSSASSGTKVKKSKPSPPGFPSRLEPDFCLMNSACSCAQPGS